MRGVGFCEESMGQQIDPHCREDQRAARRVLSWILPSDTYSAFESAVRQHGPRAAIGFSVGYGKLPRRLWRAAARNIGQDD